VGVILGLLLLAFGIWLWRKRREEKKGVAEEALHSPTDMLRFGRLSPQEIDETPDYQEMQQTPYSAPNRNADHRLTFSGVDLSFLSHQPGNLHQSVRHPYGQTFLPPLREELDSARIEKPLPAVHDEYEFVNDLVDRSEKVGSKRISRNPTQRKVCSILPFPRQRFI